MLRPKNALIVEGLRPYRHASGNSWRFVLRWIQSDLRKELSCELRIIDVYWFHFHTCPDKIALFFIFFYMYLERVFYALYKRDTLKVSYIPLPFMFTCMKKEFPARKLKETFTNTKLLIIGFMERVIEHLPLVKLLYDIYLTLPLKCYMYDYRNKDVPNALSCLIRICK